MSEWSRNPPPPEPPATPRRGRAVPLRAAIAAAALTAVLGGVAGGVVATRVTDDEGSSSAAAGGADVERRQVIEEESSIAEAVESVLPAIVTIINDELPSSDDVDVVNIGTGVIIDERGFIVTNDHVVRDSGKLRVILQDGSELPASVVSSDAPFTDVAVVRIQPQDVEPVGFGDSDSLRLGQRLIAIGTVLGDYRGTVTTGVVSGLHRTRRSETLLVEDLVQTDAAINHGSSGGPLLNTKGELVAMNTTVIRGTAEGRAVEGVALSLSSKTIRPIVEAIVERERYERPYVGIAHQDLDAEVAAQTGVGIDRGALVVRVTEGSPAEAAGIRRGDVILRMGESELSEDLPFINALAKLAPGEMSPFLILRGGAEQTLEVRVALRP
jgi:2-alkenal reductase